MGAAIPMISCHLVTSTVLCGIVQQKSGSLLVRKKPLGDVTRWAVSPMTACATVPQHQEMKATLLDVALVRLLDHQARLINVSGHDRWMVPTNSLRHAHDFALDRRVAGEVQGLSLMGATTLRAA